ncbi:MAG: nucleotidyl transferase AbiEii/AbiGii toxin family protein [Acidipropionibacterium sp.]|jgi:hypothetical protein|nr:nucleotidyl transferase AbiEii/AbiGii toxin family protein [Acidipropionibacterium sp.]
MSPTPPRGTAAGRAYNDLRNLAQRQGRDPAEFFVLYVLEGFLARLAASEHAGDFVLKGGVLMAAFAARRPTRDIDLAAAGMTNDIPAVVDRVRTIVIEHCDDGLTFDPLSVSGEHIRDDADYVGVRVKLTARLATARIAIHVDVNFGDPIWPAPTMAKLPLLLGGTLELSGYPDHMVLAEKIVTAIDRGDQNTRWRDFVDIAMLATTRTIRYADLRGAIETVAQYRDVHLRQLAPLLQHMPDLAQPRWAAWRRRQRLEAATPERFAELLDACIALADPVLDERAERCTWNAGSSFWEQPEI